MRRVVAGVVAAATSMLLLSGCAPTPGPLVDSYQAGEACAVADRRPTYVATQTIRNPSTQAVTIETVAPRRHPNSRLQQTLSGPEMNGLLIVGGYDPTHGLEQFRPFKPTRLDAGSSMMVVFVSDVVTSGKDAAVEGVHITYASGSQTFEGDIPWTYRFDAKRCS